MRIMRKFFIGKLVIISVTLLVLLWLFSEKRHGRALVFQSQAESYVVNPVEKLLWTSEACLSIIDIIKITANFTLNDVLDRMKLSFVGGSLSASLESVPHPDVAKREPPVSDDLRGETLEIIVIPHSHNDPGWLKTYDKYFEDDTNQILSLAVEKLEQYPDMTFVWVEASFLQTWWVKQTEKVRSRFRDLVRGGRIELVSGSYVAPDEASPHYYALVDQLIEGHYWIKRNIGVIPETSLSFDQFGYSASIPYLMKKAGLKNVLIKRTHRGVKQLFGEKHWMTFNWRQFWDPEGKDDIFTQIDPYEWMSISDSCGPSRHICRGLDFSTRPDLPKPGTPEANRPFGMDQYSQQRASSLHDFARLLVDQFRIKNGNYKQKVMILPHGGDFHYSKPETWDRQYRNMRLFMDYVNEHKNEFNIHMRFGTFKDYYAELERQTKKHNLKFPVVSGDFFTYTESNEYWTGYFTTRQFDKRLGREVQESLRAAELFASIALAHSKKHNLNSGNLFEKYILSNLVLARRDLGIFQHHDAITGTSRAHVAIDYEKRLTRSFTATQDALSAAIQYLVEDGQSGTSETKILSTLNRKPMQFNELTKRVPLQVPSSGTKLFLVNSLLQARREIVWITVGTDDVTLLAHSGNDVEYDITHRGDGTFEMIFEANIPPASIVTYYLQQKTKSSIDRHVTAYEPKDDSIVCENDQVNVTFSKLRGTPMQMCYKTRNFCSSVEIDWRYYKSSSGAYTMKSNGHESNAYGETLPKVSVTNGAKLCRVTATYTYFSSDITLFKTHGATGKSLRINIYSDLRTSSTQATIPAPFSGDFAMRIKSNVNNSRTFYVDSNGFQLMGRKFRHSLPFDGNVYPMTSMSLIEDTKTRLVVHSAQPHGIVSPTSGVLDLMVDRAAPRAEMGMPEGVNDLKPTKTILYIQIESADEYESTTTKETALPSIQTVYLNDILQHPIYSFYSMDTLTLSNTTFRYLTKPMSCDITLANVKNLASDSFKSEGTSLTFHRRGLSCSPEGQEQFCPLFKDTSFTPGSVLRTASQDKVTRVSLSHLMEQGKQGNYPVELKPMDIETFRLL